MSNPFPRATKELELIHNTMEYWRERAQRLQFEVAEKEMRIKQLEQERVRTEELFKIARRLLDDTMRWQWNIMWDRLDSTQQEIEERQKPYQEFLNLLANTPLPEPPKEEGK